MAQRWTKEAAIAHVRRVASEKGRTPTLRDLSPHHMAFVRLFGSISATQKAAGFTPRRPGRPRKEAR